MRGINISSGLPTHSPFYLADFYVDNPKRVLFWGGGPWGNYYRKLMKKKFHPENLVERTS